jgi:hypothetical protein
VSEYCENCGCRMYGGLCSGCQEEAYILMHQQPEASECAFSDEFMEAAGDQMEERRRRLVAAPGREKEGS